MKTAAIFWLVLAVFTSPTVRATSSSGPCEPPQDAVQVGRVFSSYISEQGSKSEILILRGACTERNPPNYYALYPKDTVRVFGDNTLIELELRGHRNRVNVTSVRDLELTDKVVHNNIHWTIRLINALYAEEHPSISALLVAKDVALPADHSQQLKPTLLLKNTPTQYISESNSSLYMEWLGTASQTSFENDQGTVQAKVVKGEQVQILQGIHIQPENSLFIKRQRFFRTNTIEFRIEAKEDQSIPRPEYLRQVADLNHSDRVNWGLWLLNTEPDNGRWNLAALTMLAELKSYDYLLSDAWSLAKQLSLPYSTILSTKQLPGVEPKGK